MAIITYWVNIEIYSQNWTPQHLVQPSTLMQCCPSWMASGAHLTEPSGNWTIRTHQTERSGNWTICNTPNQHQQYPPPPAKMQIWVLLSFPLVIIILILNLENNWNVIMTRRVSGLVNTCFRYCLIHVRLCLCLCLCLGMSNISAAVHSNRMHLRLCSISSCAHSNMKHLGLSLN